MSSLDTKRNTEVNEIIAVIRIIFGLLMVSCLYSFIHKPTDNVVLSTLIIMLIFIVVGIIIYKLWEYFVRTSYQKLRVDKMDIVYLSINILLLTVIIFITGAHKSNYKNLYFITIISNSIRYGSKMGMLSSALSAVGIVFNDLIFQLDVTENTFLEADLIIIITFFVTGWMLGTFMENEIKYRKQLSEKANTDEVTGLYNHRYFQERLNIEIQEAEKHNYKLALVMIDLDYFKYYNDTYGHQQGDLLLKDIGNLIMKSIRDNDIVCRYGGDEFALILQDTTISNATSIAERIRDSVDEKKFLGENNNIGGNITASVGVAIYPDNALDKDELIKKADDAMYKAKFVSKNRVELYFSVLDDLKASLNKSEQDLLNSIRTLITVINAKDKYTYGHSERVVLYSTMLGRAVGIEEDELKTIRYGAYLHDIGKIEISRDILNKRTRLTEEEFQILSSHPVWGADIIKPIEALKDSIPMVLHHHERFDGTGYPSGLKGYDIPLYARILTVADSFDAMVTNRPYKEAMSQEEAVEELGKCGGIQFDPALVDKFIKALENSNYAPFN